MTHLERGVKMALSPPGSPITIIYRNSERLVKMAETTKTSEQLGCIAQCWQSWAIQTFFGA